MNDHVSPTRSNEMGKFGYYDHDDEVQLRSAASHFHEDNALNRSNLIGIQESDLMEFSHTNFPGASIVNQSGLDVSQMSSNNFQRVSKKQSP